MLDCAPQLVDSGVGSVDGELLGAKVPGEQGVHVRSATLVAAAL
jgi:hypothetical protein